MTKDDGEKEKAFRISLIDRGFESEKDKKQ